MWIVLFTDIVSTVLSPIVMWYTDMKKTFFKLADVGKQILHTSSSAAASRQGQIRDN